VHHRRIEGDIDGRHRHRSAADLYRAGVGHRVRVCLEQFRPDQRIARASGAPAAAVTETADKPTPAQIRKSVTPDALISFIDGKPYKTLKRHLSRNGLTIEQYRERFGLPRDYPSTAASYSAQRSELARSLGLGQQRRKSAAPVQEPEEEPAEKPKKATRPRKAKETA
jgi:predicted transcriptional regulator